MPDVLTRPLPCRQGMTLPGLAALVLSVSLIGPPETLAQGAGARAPSVRLPKHYVCTRARGTVTIDGRIDEPAWADAPWTDPFEDIEGEVRPRPRFRTRARMLWDDRYFYVAARLDEPHVWGTLTRHDSVIFHDNDFEVFIDPDGDNHEYYEFEINALNTGWDLFLKKPYRDGGPAENGWEIPGLLTAVRVEGTLNDPTDTDRGWTVEIAFPWKVLAEFAHQPAPPREGDVWRVNFSRVEWEHVVEGRTYTKVPGRKEDNWVWSPQGRVDMHMPERWGFVHFTARPAAELRVEADPAQPVRDRLMEVYHAQKRFREKNGRWAKTPDELILPAPAPGGPSGKVALRVRDDGTYEASLPVTEPGGKVVETWTIGHDSRLTRKPGG